jgi:hypothetical protein
MTLASARAVFEALDRAGVRFLVVGGLAVNAHGYPRFTKDIDVVIELVPDNIRAAFDALARAGYRPIVPVRADQFADADLRQAMIRDKGMQVLQFHSDRHRETPVDVFVTEPFPFDDEYERRALVKRLGDGPAVRFASARTLIAMKEKVGRPEDRLDVHHLRRLLDDDGGADTPGDSHDDG